MRRIHFKAGQSITEYVLAGGLVALVAIAGLQLLNTGLMASMQGLSGKFGPTAGAAAAGGFATPGGITTATGGTAGMPSFQQVQQLVASGRGSEVNDRILDNLLTRVNELAAAGQITPDETGFLTALANQGYQIASLQRQMEDAVNNSSTPDALLDTELNFNGQNLEFDDLLSVLEPCDGCADLQPDGTTHVGRMSYEEFLATQPKEGSLTGSFIKLMQQAENSNAMQDPQLRQLVEAASLNILDSATVYSDIYVNKADSDKYKGKSNDDPAMLDNLKKSVEYSLLEVYRKSTEQSSETICTAGSGTAADGSCL